MTAVVFRDLSGRHRFPHAYLFVLIITVLCQSSVRSAIWPSLRSKALPGERLGPDPPGTRRNAGPL
ncbi:hypothetical protein PO124_00515 [Bacillus licheniformis]|nr:hypothetical protein [Bacillus licheniformis]